MDRMGKIQLPAEVGGVLEKLNDKGFEAFAVGGCVRDSILGRVPKDWDVTTNAKPEEIKQVFDRTVDTGIRHGTVTVLTGGTAVEVTTYRIDGRYEDGRHPENVEFTASLEEDLRRRDFTMNAIAWHPSRGRIDPYGGMEDIAAGRIRTVGDPRERFEEDALRMLRAIRFSAQLDFSIHEDVLSAIKTNCRSITQISCERIRDELTKLLVSKNPLRFILLRDTDLLQYILPEFEVCFHTEQNNPHHIYNVAVHTLKVVAAIPGNRILRWAALLHDIGKPLSKTTDEKGIDHFYNHQHKSADLSKVILRRLRFDNKSMERIIGLVLNHDTDIYPTQKAVRKAVAKTGEEFFEDLLQLKEGDRRAQAPEYLEEGLEKIRRVREILDDLRRSGQAFSLRNLAVNGNDLLELGLRPGPKMKETLNDLLELVLDNPRQNTREILLDHVRRKERNGG